LEAFVGLVTVSALFVCVVLHELGHALTARRFGIGTSDITLLPIGGVARLERMPKKPSQEFWVAVAGPAVNVVIAAVLLGIMLLIGQEQIASANLLSGQSILANLFTINVVLVIFNMLPAFPMDGGRVLRSLLAMKLPYLQATQIAARVGQMMAVMFALLGLLGNPFLFLIALFVFVGAGGEVRMAQLGELIGNLRVAHGMMTRFRTLTVDDTLQTVSDEILAGHQYDFPVCRDGRYIGMFCRDQLGEAISEHGTEYPIETLVKTDQLTTHRDANLEHLASEMQSKNVSTAAVLDGEQVVGVISLENINELVMIRSARANRLNRDVPSDEIAPLGMPVPERRS
jgi:Zn-dependent protease